MPRQLGGDRLDRLAHDGRHVHGHPLAVEVGEEAAEPGDGAAAVDHRAVAAGPSNRRLQPADLLLGHLDRIEALAAHLEREAAELAERVAHAREQLRVLLDEVARAEVAAGLLVGEDDEHEVAGELGALPLRAHEGADEHRDARLHVERAAAPDVAVLEPALERRVRPVLAGGRDDVDVPLEQERRRVAAGEAADEVRPAGLLLVELRLAARVLELRAEELDARRFVAGRVRRVEPDQLLQELRRAQHSSSSAVSSRSTSSSVL